MVECTRESGLRTNNMEKGDKHLLMGKCMRETLSMINLMGKVDHRLYISIHLGVYKWPTGSNYTGGFIDGKRHGQGLMRW